MECNNCSIEDDTFDNLIENCIITLDKGRIEQVQINTYKIAVYIYVLAPTVLCVTDTWT